MKNKRSLFIVIAMVLLLAVVLGMGGTTFAKYITKDSAPSQTATVAKWGHTIDITDGVLFGEKYNVEGNVDEAAGTAIVSSRSSTKVLAPGAKDSLTFTIGGTSEVMSQFDIAVTGQDISLTKTSDSSVYNPVKWTLRKDGAVVNSLENVTLAAIVEELNKTSYDAATAANGTPTVNGTYVISYEWPFSVDENTDALDTILGDIAAEKTVDGYTAQLNAEFSITISVAQAEPDGNP